MGVYKRGTVWWSRLRVDGAEIRQSAGPGSTKKDAEELEKAYRRQIAEHERARKLGKTPRRTIDDALLRWLNGPAQALKSYRQTLNHARAVRQFTRGRWLDEGPQVAAEICESGLAHRLRPATINQRLAIIRRILNLAYQWSWLDQELGRKIKLISPRNERHIYLTEPEIAALAAAAGEAGDAILLLAYTGLRLGELFRLTSANLIDGTIILDAATKSGRPRIIPIPEPALQCAIPVTVTRDRFRRRFEQARLAIGRPDLHAHDLRHTYASLLVRAGAPLPAIRDLLGHAHLGVTSRYAHLARDDLKTAVGLLKKAGTKTGTGEK